MAKLRHFALSVPDPEAAAMFWQFAMMTKGAFIAPSRDWP